MSKLVSLYPRRWKERYGQEFERVLGDYPKTTRTVSNVIWGALVAHLQERFTKRRNGMSTASRILGSTWFLIAIAAVALIVYAGLGVWVALWWFRYEHFHFQHTSHVHLEYLATRWHTWRGAAVGALGVSGTLALAILIARRYLSIRLIVARRTPTGGQSTPVGSA